MSAPILPEREHAALCDALCACACETWRLWGRRAPEVKPEQERAIRALRHAVPTDGFVSFAEVSL